MFSLYLDEDASDRALVRALRLAGFDCLTAHEAERVRQSDEEQLVFAAVERRVLYTKNYGDFSRIHSQWIRTARSHSGIIVVTRQRMPVGVQLSALQEVARRFEAEEMVDRLVFLLSQR